MPLFHARGIFNCKLQMHEYKTIKKRGWH
jgi:hypothetical protein